MLQRLVRISYFFLIIAGIFAAQSHAQTRGQQASIVVGTNASPVEQFAASELQKYLDKLFGIEAATRAEPTANSTVVFLLGQPSTNPLIKNFPKVSDQGIVIKNAPGKVATLIVGGGSAQATLWAVYELAHHWGVRYSLIGDSLPPKTTFRMPMLNVAMEPLFKVRAHGTTNVDFADSGEGWGIDGYRKLIDYLAKMKFNRLNVGGYAWQPYLKYEVDGIKRQTVALWYGYHYPITPDMPGRAAFPADMKEFWNPDLPVNGTPDEMLTAGIRLQQELIDYAHSRGMETVTSATVSEYPKEFARVLGGSVPIHMMGQLTTTPGPDTKLDDPGLHKLSSTIVRATINTYPEVDRVNLSINEWRQWTDQYERAWNALDAKYHINEVTTLDKVLYASRHRAGYAWGAAFSQADLEKKASDEVKGDLASLFFFDWLVRDSGAVSESKRPNMKFLYWGFAEELFPILPRVLPPNSELEVMPDNFLDHLLQRPQILKTVSGGPIKPIINLTMDDDNIGIIPQMTTSALEKVLALLRQTGWEGVVARERFPGDHDTEMEYLARASWDANLKPESVVQEQLNAACGKACGEQLAITIKSIDDATHVWQKDDEHFSFPVPSLLMKYWKPDPMPEYFEQNRKNYERGWLAAKKAVSLATPEGKSYAKFWEKRMEFATKYISAVQAARRAAIAEGSHQTQLAAKETSTAIDILTDALNAYATVARTQSDRGAIAVAVEYGYRPLKKKLAELQQSSGATPAGNGE
jgi:hypothetical protein